jgi:zinc/manganese transport system substrate-binding protein/manganese/iron transport system substrate-binding protein
MNHQPLIRLAIISGLVGLTSLASAQQLNVATSFSIIEDLVKNVGGNRVSITNFVPRDGDAHTYQPGTQDVKNLADARLVFINGLGLENWFQPLLKNAASKARVITLSDGLKPLKLEGDHQGEDHKDDHGEFDPHMWWNPTNTIAYVRKIQAALEKTDPAGTNLYKTNADRYAREFANLDAWAKTQVAQIPKANRKLVTNHDALGYFAARYGFKVIGNVIPSLGTEREPSAKETASLVKAIRREKVKAIFTENTVSARLAETVARETGAKIAPPLYTDALGAPGSSGDTFLKAFRHNVMTIVNALR